MNRPLVETHCHLDLLKALPLEEILQRSTTEGVEKLITISAHPKSLRIVKELALKHDFVFCTQGIHPHQAKDWDTSICQNIEESLVDPLSHKIVAVGEIGLDFHYDYSPRAKQQEIFSLQMELASKAHLPVVIHARKSDTEMISLLKKFAPLLKKKGVIHSFTSGVELARMALDLGFFLGFNGIITFKKAEEVREIVKFCPLERILLETDAPFLAPVPHRGKENAPYYLPCVAQKVAELKGASLEEVCHQTSANAHELFAFQVL